MLEKGAIAGKMMGSLWFAYSKFRGDWQNLSVCKIWMIQTIFYSPSLCLNTFYIPEYSVAVEVADSLLQNLTRKTKWAVSNMGEHRNSCSPAPGSLMCCDHWPVERAGPGHTSHCPRWPGSHGVTCASVRPHNTLPTWWPLTPPPPGSICHLSPGHWAETKPFKAHVPRMTH